MMEQEHGRIGDADRAAPAGAAEPAPVSGKAGIPCALRYAAVTEERHNLLRSVISALAEQPGRAQIVVQMPQRTAIMPREVWIEDIAAWARLDGSRVSLDLGRGIIEPSPSEAVCIRLAAEHWDAAQAIEARSAKTEGLGPKDESAVPTGDAPHA